MRSVEGVMKRTAEVLYPGVGHGSLFSSLTEGWTILELLTVRFAVRQSIRSVRWGEA